MDNSRYIIMKLDDAKALADSANHNNERLKEIIERIENEAGADILDIVSQLKKMQPCPACTIEGQEQTCNFYHANRLGRRIRRLVSRAEHEILPENKKTQ